MRPPAEPESLEPELAPEALLAPSPASVEDEASAVVLARARLELERSFFAQPEPLKWIDGAEKAFRTGDAPQIGQASGPLAATPCITSKRWPFGQM